ncbi:FYVE, RhoGEF and PH domain-containing protein 2-like [Clavelina lepadiformis]|uniref:FYVE, RhoGEF and PH domain-containing protein 2-like n=1 Tax=Clavelina lepadiformis TaxID=159417 RepID=UPI00404119DE
MLSNMNATSADNVQRSKTLRVGNQGRRDGEEAVHLCNALRIYENSMANICKKNSTLTDEGFSAAHQNSSAQAMGHLKDTHCSMSACGMLSDMIKVKRQRFKLGTTSVLMKNDMENTQSRPFTSEDVPMNVKAADQVIGSHITSSKSESNNKKLKKIAEELLSTEKTYVNILHQIDQIFYKKVQEASVMKKVIPESDAIKIFGHVTAIYQFHSNFLLPQLQDRIKNWHTNPRIGDVMMQAGPFLKMYALYTQNFDKSSKLLDDLLKKSKRFATFITLIQIRQENQNLPLQTQMISPIQRIPRYELLLKDYLKRLPDDAMDRQEAESALALIADAAAHSNEILSFIDGCEKRNKKLQSISDVNFDITEASRELIKEGPIKRLDNWEDKQFDSQLCLLSDILLDCAPIFKVGRKKSHKVRAKVDLTGADVCEVTTYDSSYGFCVHGIKSSMEFATSSNEERQEWTNAIKKAIGIFEVKRRSFRGKLQREETVMFCSDAYTIKNELLGKQCPRWIKDREASKCMICKKDFSALLRIKHHCRACAKIVCAECSGKQFRLEYSTDELQRVCDLCHNILSNRITLDPTQDKLVGDYLCFSNKSQSKKEKKYFCLIPCEEPKLFFLKASRDIEAERVITLNKFKVACNKCQDGLFRLKLERKDKIYYLSTKDKEIFVKWNWVLTELAKGTPLTKEDIEAAEKQQYSSS